MRDSGCRFWRPWPAGVRSWSAGRFLAGNHRAAGLQVDPFQVEDIYSGLKQILMDPVRRQKMIRAGLDQACLYSWKATAQKVLQIFEELAKNI